MESKDIQIINEINSLSRSLNSLKLDLSEILKIPKDNLWLKVDFSNAIENTPHKLNFDKGLFIKMCEDQIQQIEFRIFTLSQKVDLFKK